MDARTQHVGERRRCSQLSVGTSFCWSFDTKRKTRALGICWLWNTTEEWFCNHLVPQQSLSFSSRGLHQHEFHAMLLLQS
jgi:hypothetical protein